MLAPVPGVVSVAVQRGEDARGRRRTARPGSPGTSQQWSEAIRHPQSERHRPRCPHTAGSLPSSSRLPSTKNSYLRASHQSPSTPDGWSSRFHQVMLLVPQALGAETEPQPVPPQRPLPVPPICTEDHQGVSSSGERDPIGSLGGISDLPLGPSNPPPQAVELQLLLLLHRRHFASSDTRTPCTSAPVSRNASGTGSSAMSPNNLPPSRRTASVAPARRAQHRPTEPRRRPHTPYRRKQRYGFDR